MIILAGGLDVEPADLPTEGKINAQSNFAPTSFQTPFLSIQRPTGNSILLSLQPHPTPLPSPPPLEYHDPVISGSPVCSPRSLILNAIHGRRRSYRESRTDQFPPHYSFPRHRDSSCQPSSGFLPGDPFFLSPFSPFSLTWFLLLFLGPNHPLVSGGSELLVHACPPPGLHPRRLDECFDLLRSLSLARSPEVRGSFQRCRLASLLLRRLSQAFQLTMLINPSSDFDLTIRQQPDRARVAGGKEKERKPIDPPPVVQVRVRDESSYLAQ